MKKKIASAVFLICLYSGAAEAQSFAFGDHWYNNPLGFSPLELHAANGFLIPAAAVTACLLLTNNDTSLTNRYSFYNEDGVSWGYKIPYTTLFQDNIGITYGLRRWMQAGAELSFYFPRDEYNNTAGIGIRPFARFFPVNGENWRLYFECGAGLIYFFDNFPKSTYADPRLGTYLNATSKYGIGSGVNLDKSTSLVFGVRHIHVSNGNLEGSNRNPSHDSNGFFIGFTYEPRRSLP
ncbi:MAG TPA: acyloxyacyl hydrolase [Candidatus Acidoferrales bacterium]|nr:acyloxyacyl hydrolase [Candidatus Acidoferrales bacterium]